LGLRVVSLFRERCRVSARYELLISAIIILVKASIILLEL
jgi:hypothetical protein